MQALTDHQLLELCGRGRGRHPVDRALLLLAAAMPEEPHVRLAELPIACRDRMLLALRCATFGQRWMSYVDCAGCGERLEFEVDPSVLLGTDTSVGADTVVSLGERRFRLPNSADLAHIAQAGDEQEAARELAILCCLEGVGREALTPEALDELDAAFMAADPDSTIQINLECPVCRRPREEVLDVSEYFWEEIETRARLVLGQVHRLATAYGWSEREILSLSGTRRAMYLELVDS